MNTAAQPTFKAGQAWLVIIITIICSLSMAMVTFKGLSTAPLLMEYFSVDIGSYGTITAAIGAVAIIGSVPSGIILAKLGPRRLVILCLAVGAASAYLQIIGAAIPGIDYLTFMLMGVPGSFVYGMWTVNGPFLTTAWFPAEKRGLPNSISTAWVTLAMMIVLNVSTPLFSIDGINPETGDVYASGFIYVWWAIAILMTICVVLAFIFIRMPKPENNFMVGMEGGQQNKGSIIAGFKNFGVWMIIVMFLLYGFVTAAYGNYYVTYLNDDVAAGGFGMSVGDSNLLSSVTTYVMLAMNFLYGFLLNKIPHKHYGTFSLIITILTIIVAFAMFNLPGVGFVAPFLIVYGIVSQMYPPVCWIMLPEITDSPEEFSAASGVVSVIANVAGVLATAVVGVVQGAFGTWQSITIPYAVLSVLGLIAAIIFIPFFKKKYAQHRAGEAAPAAE